MELKRELGRIVANASLKLIGQERFNRWSCDSHAKELMDDFYEGKIRLRDALITADNIAASGRFEPVNFRERFEKAMHDKGMALAPSNELPWSLLRYADPN